MSLAEGIRTRLEETVGEVYFSDIAAHLERDAVFVVTEAELLVPCGVAVATDDVERVTTWIGRGALRKPSRAERAAWPDETGRTFRVVVVQPFVLVELVRQTSASSDPSV